MPLLDVIPTEKPQKEDPIVSGAQEIEQEIIKIFDIPADDSVIKHLKVAPQRESLNPYLSEGKIHLQWDDYLLVCQIRDLELHDSTKSPRNVITITDKISELSSAESHGLYYSLEWRIRNWNAMTGAIIAAVDTRFYSTRLRKLRRDPLVSQILSHSDSKPIEYSTSEPEEIL